MKTLKSLSIALTVLLISQVSVLKADDLFSNSGLQNVFKNTQQTAPTTQSTNNRVTNNDLKQFVEAMGYTVKDLGDSIYLIQVKEGIWTFEPVISLSKGGTRIWININLKTYKTSNDLNAQQLMKLLNANLTYGPAVFNYNMKSNRIALTRSCKNENLLPAELKAIIVDLCKTGVETEALWNIQTEKTFAKPQPAPQQTQKPTQPYWLKKVSLEETPVNKRIVNNPVGQWLSGKINGQIFGLRFNSDGTYLYVLQEGEKQTKVNGRYEIIENILTLTSDSGEKLSGTLVWKTDSSFSFITLGAAPGATGVLFNKLDK